MFTPSPKHGKRPLSMRDWEANIDDVVIEPCADDATGLRAKFFLKEQYAAELAQRCFTVGASFLAQRAKNLESAGYRASMTERALSILENQFGDALCSMKA